LSGLSQGRARANHFLGVKLMEEEEERQDVGKADRVSMLYIACGVPAIILFTVVLFAFTRWFNIPA
jgi:hypothetical protein